LKKLFTKDISHYNNVIAKQSHLCKVNIDNLRVRNSRLYNKKKTLNKENFQIEPSSFRDNLGNIFYIDNRVLRTINNNGKKNLEFIINSKILDDSIKNNFLINTKIINKAELPNFFSRFEYVVESDLIPYISYPYEWSFEQLKCAAIHHLDFQIFLFNKSAVLRDASAYNIQFIGSKPIFIDLLSIKEYQEGDHWIGYKQFCENFLKFLHRQIGKSF
jgi:hypothetical protein